MGNTEDAAAMASDSEAETAAISGNGDIPEWLPGGFPLPDDFKLDGANNIGTSTHLINGRSDMPADQIYDFFADGLAEAGYDVRSREDYREQNMVYFEGNGCHDCTVTFTDAGAWRTMRISLTLPTQE